MNSILQRTLASMTLLSPFVDPDRYATVTLSGNEVTCRALDFQQETLPERRGVHMPIYDVERHVQFSQEVLAKAGVEHVMPGDTFTDTEGVTWEMSNALRFNGMIRARLVAVQPAP